MKTLNQIGCEQGTDRASNGLHDYLRTYEEFLSPIRDQPVRLLEMGVLGGAGIRMWSEYLTHPFACIVGIDIQDYGGKIPDDRRVRIAYGSQSDRAFLDTVWPNWDVVIDDAGHFAQDQIKSFEIMWPRVNPGGLYFLEDIHTGHSPQHCNANMTIIHFVQRFICEMQDHNGATGAARYNPSDQWHDIDQLIVRKGLAIFRKRGQLFS